jgi:putative methionine-R-sulfoxide reductase with GAF domain
MTTTGVKPTDLIPELNSLVSKFTVSEALMKAIVALLHEKLTRYNWVGFLCSKKNPIATFWSRAPSEAP